MREQEAKFVPLPTLPAKAAVRLVKSSLRSMGCQIESSGKRTLHDTYLDTPDRALINAALCCRHRQAGKDQGRYQLKQLINPAGVFDRMEFSIPDDDLAALWQHPDMVKLAIPSDTLNSLFEQTTRRKTYDISHPAYTSKVQWCVDRVVVRHAKATYIEFEFEHQSGSPVLLHRLNKHLNRLPELIPSGLSKFQRGTFLSGSEVRHATAKPTSCGHRLTDHMRGLQAITPHVREAFHPEAIHQYRVLIRRIQASILLFAPAERALASQLSTLTGLLGRARDLDLICESLSGVSLQPYARQRQQMQHEIHIYFDQNLPELAQTLLKVANSLQHAQASELLNSSSLKLAADLKKLFETYPRLRRKIPLNKLHKVRKRNKRLTYQMDELEPFVSPTVRKSLHSTQDCAREVNQLLGRVQDSRILTEAMSDKKKSDKKMSDKKKSDSDKPDKQVMHRERQSRKSRQRLPDLWQSYSRLCGQLAEDLSKAAW